MLIEHWGFSGYWENCGIIVGYESGYGDLVA